MIAYKGSDVIDELDEADEGMEPPKVCAYVRVTENATGFSFFSLCLYLLSKIKAVYRSEKILCFQIGCLRYNITANTKFQSIQRKIVKYYLCNCSIEIFE